MASSIVGSRFRHLGAYRLSVEVADDIHVRALDSVGANIAESSGRWDEADKRRLLVVARGSLYEAERWMLRAEARGLLTPGRSDRLSELARVLNGMVKRPTPG
ncbi:MAG TPA: four helix bundle protein [Thermoleophilaceae bacterium]|jgi:four helix bundle protein|nr:four helix bundle protein [Thermoleophilaceae bacterium]